MHLVSGKGELFFVTRSSIEKVSSLKLMPKELSQHSWDKILKSKAIISFQNGIGHTDEDFLRIAAKINQVAKSSQLIINLYNPTDGTFGDVKHVAMHKMNVSNHKLESFIFFTEELLGFLEMYKKKTPYTHFAHSEAGIICENTLRALSKTSAKKAMLHLDVITLGSPRPVSKEFVKSAVNIYSENDYLIIPFVKLFENNPNFIFKEAKSLSHEAQKRFKILDHSMDGDTYFHVIKHFLSRGKLDEQLFTQNTNHSTSSLKDSA